MSLAVDIFGCPFWLRGDARRECLDAAAQRQAERQATRRERVAAGTDTGSVLLGISQDAHEGAVQWTGAVLGGGGGGGNAPIVLPPGAGQPSPDQTPLYVAGGVIGLILVVGATILATR